MIVLICLESIVLASHGGSVLSLFTFAACVFFGDSELLHRFFGLESFSFLSCLTTDTLGFFGLETLLLSLLFGFDSLSLRLFSFLAFALSCLFCLDASTLSLLSLKSLALSLFCGLACNTLSLLGLEPLALSLLSCLASQALSFLSL